MLEAILKTRLAAVVLTKLSSSSNREIIRSVSFPRKGPGANSRRAKAGVPNALDKHLRRVRTKGRGGGLDSALSRNWEMMLEVVPGVPTSSSETHVPTVVLRKPRRHKSTMGNSCSIGSAEISTFEADVHSVSIGASEEADFTVDFPEGRIWGFKNGRVVDSIVSFILPFSSIRSSEVSMKWNNLVTTASMEAIVLNMIGSVDTAAKQGRDSDECA